MWVYSWFRVLIPSWGFFEDAGACPLVCFRYGANQQNLSEWQVAFAPQPRKAWQVVFNPSDNQRLLVISAFAKLATESQNYLTNNHKDFTQTVDYRVCSKIIRAQIPATAKTFQFKITARTGESPPTHRMDAFVSLMHEAEQP